MKLYLLTQDTNNEYDTFDSMVVAAESKSVAVKIPPGDYDPILLEKVWVPAKEITVVYLGVAAPSVKRGVICASFNAG